MKKGSHHTEKTRKEMSESHKKRYTKELRKELSEARKGKGNSFYGKHHTEKTKHSIGKKSKERWEDLEFRKRFKKVHSKAMKRLEVRKKLSESDCGWFGDIDGHSKAAKLGWEHRENRKMSEKTKRKLSKANRGKNVGNKNVMKRKDVYDKWLRIIQSEKYKKNMSVSCKEAWDERGEEMKKEVSIRFKELWKDPIFRKTVLEARKKTYSTPKFKRERSELSKEMWKNPEFRENTVKAILKGLMKRPTPFEQQIIELIEKHNLPFKYCGDGELLIGYRNPDFIHDNGKKLLIEVYANYFKIKEYGSCENYEKQRGKLFSKYGFKTLFLREEDMLRKDSEQHTLSKIKCFTEQSN